MSLVGTTPETSGALQIWVRLKAHYIWMQDLPIKLAAGRYLMKRRLLHYWRAMECSSACWLQDTDVLDNDLLETVDSRKRVSFETRFLSRFIGPAFHADHLNPENLVSVIKSLADIGVKDALQKELPHRCLKEKCAQWSRKADELWIKDL